MDKFAPYIEGFLDAFLKIIFPALAGVSIKLALQMKKEKMKFLQIILSYVIGIGMAWICSPLIRDGVPENYQSVIVAIVAISGEKIAEFIIYKWDVDLFLMALANGAKDFVVNLFSTRRNEG